MDTRSPFVIGIHDLSRRPGTMRTYTLEVPAPADLAIEVIGVPEGAPVTLDVRLESIVEGVLASAEISAPLVGECVRCLGEVTDRIDVDFTELYAYPGAIEHDPDDDEADEVHELTGDFVDVEQAVRDAVVLALPFQPYCRPDCKGLCPECGADLNEAGTEHGHEKIDARWAALVDALTRDDENDETSETPRAPRTSDTPDQQDVP
ncbi:DUF177 domain-containing protein [Miniimonas sp. S16]|uniref:YceD family protein n=1 Tax=Miniimonas sp. S16 TaxID=2171623 RepID=UPI001F3661D7|nr:DUF177 domain-containing protein [Miniimonas sp. S16]